MIMFTDMLIYVSYYFLDILLNSWTRKKIYANLLAVVNDNPLPEN
jgi:hypothetical protein